MFSLNSIVGINKQIVYRDLDNGRFMSKVHAGKRIKHAIGDALREKSVVNTAFIDQLFPAKRTVKSAKESAKVFMELLPPEPPVTVKSGKFLRKAGKVGLILAGAAAIIAGGTALYNKFVNKKTEAAKIQQTENETPRVEENTVNSNQKIATETVQNINAEEKLDAAKYVDKTKNNDKKEDKTPEELLTEAIAILDEVLAGIDNAQN